MPGWHIRISLLQNLFFSNCSGGSYEKVNNFFNDNVRYTVVCTNRQNRFPAK